MSWLKFRAPNTTPSKTMVVKRGEGCKSLNGATTFNAGGAVFDIFCGMTWAYYDSLFVSYTPNFQTCMENCVRWNTNNGNQCVGVFWIYGQYGPLGVEGGSE